MEDGRAATRQVFGEPWPEFNGGLTYKDVVKSSNTTACTLIEFYSSKHSNSAPLEGWLQRVRNGQIAVDGEVVTDPDITLRDDSVLLYFRLPWKEPFAPYLLEVLFEDDDMVAINKPSGLQVLPGGFFQQRTVLTQLRWHAEKSSSSAPVPVHRLGRGTSGILLCAKTTLAKTRLAEYFADGTAAVKDNRSEMELGTIRRISKIYRALASGIIVNDEVLVKQPIGIMKYPSVAKGLYVASSSGKPALSKVIVLERDIQRNQTLVQVEIQSGRPHQIRIHLSFMGHPLVDDPLYGIDGQPKCADSGSRDHGFALDGGYQRPKEAVPGDCGYYLHAHQLVLCHPTINKVIEVTAPLPPMLQARTEAEGRQQQQVSTE